jgi:spermidine synthase
MEATAREAPDERRRATATLGGLFVLSGAAALIYQVLWLKQLGTLFGNSAQAAAATLAIFFLGLSLGSRALGRRAGNSPNPLRAYAFLEVGIAAAALLYFPLFDLYAGLYPRLAQLLGAPSIAFTAAKLLLAGVMLFPSAFLMGGTLPYMIEHMVRRRDQLGSRFSWLYGCNTVGGAAGAFAAAFVLPQALGFTRAFAVPLLLNLAVAAVAAALSRESRGASRPTAASDAAPGRTDTLLVAVAFFSGAATLGLEVLWTRMFAQVLHNSVYSFATILVVFLVALALGAALANRLCRLSTAPALVLPWLLLGAGMAAGLSPFVFHAATGGLTYVAPAAGWWEYVATVFATAGGVLLLPGVAIGSVFPYLARVAAADGTGGPGVTAGRLVSWNTVGSILGSLAAGFVLIEILGLYASMSAIAFAYLLLALLLAPPSDRTLRLALAGAIAVSAIVLNPSRLPLVRMMHDEEFVRETWETGQGIVAVTQAGPTRLLKVDSHYSLGGTSARTYEEAQADIPLILHPDPKRVFFLGMGTGITAGAALRHRVDSLTVCELLPAVVTAAKRHFSPYVNGLFEDPRAKIVVEDGRQYLLVTEERYDVIIADLFVPWQAGAGSLYTREHFEVVRSRLRSGGLFAQWLPLYQLSARDAQVIMRTMLEVFPEVTVWRGDFMPNQPIIALIGQESGARLDPEAVTANFRHRRGTSELSRELAVAFTSLFYVGNLGASRELVAGLPLNTDDDPFIEYEAPVAQREQAEAAQSGFVSFELAEFQDKLARRVPPASDPFLAGLSAAEREFALAGADLFHAVLRKGAGDADAAAVHAAAFAQRVPKPVYELFRKDVEVERKGDAS